MSDLNCSWTTNTTPTTTVIGLAGVIIEATLYNSTTTWWRRPGPFDFWDDPAEDIYSPDDGESL